MSINVFPLSHQVGTIWRHAYLKHYAFSFVERLFLETAFSLIKSFSIYGSSTII